MDIKIKNRTYVALISREFPSDLARNLVLMRETIASLFSKSDAELALLGLSERNILAIKDSKRPSIPDRTLRQVLSDSWRTCCICHSTGEPIVVHHIEEWAISHSHAEKNLAVLCLKHHDEAHTKLGTSLKLPASEIREWKKKWVARAASIRRSLERRIAETEHRSARWHWIHYDNLMRETIGMTPQIQTNIPEDRLAPLREGKFINVSGALNPSDLWIEKLLKKKNYLFDSGCALLMGLYVSDMLGKFIAQSSCLDISGFLDKPSIIKQYVRENAFVFFRCPIEVEKREGEELTLRVVRPEVRIEMKLDLWNSLNASSKGTYLPTDFAERSVVGTVQSVVADGPLLKMKVSPLGVSADFVLDGPAQGDWVERANNAPRNARLARAKQ